MILALGGDLKNAPALARGNDLHLCAYNGDLETAESLAQFETQIGQVLQLYGVSPDVVVHDLHPHYHSSKWPGLPSVRRVMVQHHFGHALSVMAEHGLEETLALSFDGTGYGTDGAIWGGEFLYAARGGFTRLGSFAPFPLPGGDEAVRHPPRIAFSLLGSVSSGRIPGLEKSEEAFLGSMIAGNVNCPTTTSLGRIFDAAAAILGLVDHTSYEGEGPIRLEGKGLAARTGSVEPVMLPFLPGPGDERIFLVDPRPILLKLLEERRPNRLSALSLEFHAAVAHASLEGARRLRKQTGVSRMVLSGGVFQNLLLRELLIPLLIKEGFEVFLNEGAPAGDGGLAVGQAWYQQR